MEITEIVKIFLIYLVCGIIFCFFLYGMDWVHKYNNLRNIYMLHQLNHNIEVFYKEKNGQLVKKMFIAGQFRRIQRYQKAIIARFIKGEIEYFGINVIK